MLDAWLGEKHSLYNKDSSFKCDDTCPRYGCRGDLLVDASLFEIYALAKYLQRPVAETFKRYFSLAPFVEHGFDRVRVRFALSKPCPFLNEKGYCTVYEKRPAACALFPEYLSIAGTIDSYVEFPCVSYAGDVPESRKDALKNLFSMHSKEMYAGEIYLFGCAGYTVDIREEIACRRGNAAGDEVSFGIQREALQAALNRNGRLRRIHEKTESLDAPGGIEQLFLGMKIVDALKL